MTTCEHRALAAALVLARSFLRHHAGEALVVVADEEGEPVAPGDEGLRVVAGRTLGIDRFDVLAASLDAADLAGALVPFALGAVDAPAVYLSPDAEVVAPIDLPDGDVLVTVGDGDSIVDDGFVAAAGPGAAAILDRWRAEPERAIASLLRDEGVRIVRDPGWAVTAAAAAARRLREEDGRLVFGDGEPVSWLRFAGVDPRAPHTLPGLDPARQRVLARVFQRYAEEVRATGGPPGDPGFARLADGTAFTPLLRSLFARGAAAGDLRRGPFDEAGQRDFALWLNDPDPSAAAGGVSRYLLALYSSRPDLGVLFPDLRKPADRAAFHRWVIVHGAGEVPIPDWLLPPEPEGLRDGVIDTGEPGPFGVNVAGYFQSELGVGEAARRVVRALDAAKVPLLPVQGSIVPPSRRGHPFGSADTSAAQFPFNLVCVNADGLPAFAREASAAFFDGRYTIGMWWWELPDFPDEYREAFDYLDEVWVGTRYVQDAIAPVAPVPVVRIPLPVESPSSPVARSRGDLGLPDGFLFLFMFDYNSVFERKNPLGAIEAFSRAFPPGSGASLVVKSINGGAHPEEHQRLLLAAGRHRDVHVIDGYVSAGDRDAMLLACDAYVSLHRSEGFGLTLAEAMALGKPAIATGWSGNVDFMDETTGWLVPAALIEVGEGNDPYPADGRWADPDLDAAAAAMREVRDDPSEAYLRASRGAGRIAETHSPVAVGSAMRARLELLRGRAADHARAADRDGGRVGAPAIAAARRRLAQGPEQFRARGRDPLTRAARKALLRSTRPVTVNQQSVDAALLDAVEQVAADVRAGRDAVAAAHATLSASALERQRQAEERAASFERRTDELAAAVRRLQEELAPLRDGARAIPYMAGDPLETFEHPVAGRVRGYRGADPPADAEDGYRLFEDVFRGSRERVMGLLGGYVDLLRDAAPVLDVGCGRGELLELLRDAAIEARGVDLDAGMARVAQERGLDVTVADAVEHLEGLPPGSLGAIASMHMIEHLPYEVLQPFLRAAVRALRPRGMLVCETVNPHAPHALKAFWIDPTHQHPLFPEVALVLARAAGFESAFVTHLRGVRDVDVDSFREDSYTLVAEAPAG